MPSSATVNFPLCAVPAGLLAVVGLNVTDTWQFPPAEIEDPHQFETTLNGAAAVIDAIPRAKVFGLVMVTVLAVDTVPT